MTLQTHLHMTFNFFFTVLQIRQLDFEDTSVIVDLLEGFGSKLKVTNV